MHERGVGLSSVVQRIQRRHVPAESAEHAFAAVSLVLRDGPDGAELLFVQRAEHASDPWSGDIAFPGGKPEATDKSLLDTALRETYEETGLRLAPTGLLARLPDVQTYTRGLRVAEFVFPLVGICPPLELGPELQRTLWVRLPALLARENRRTVERMRAGRRIEFPCIAVGDHVVWGLTYRMTLQLLELVALD
jgi:8-oxo-dGTP pyrophosphatase MutT (NUDIX family)